MVDAGVAVTVDVVHEALSCIYCSTELAKTALFRLLGADRLSGDVVEQAQTVRDLLLDAIEALRPAGKATPSASASRAYQCLTFRYVSGLTVDDLAYEMHISSRQAYRDLHWAEERLTQVLRQRLQDLQPLAPSPSPPSTLSEELEAIGQKPEPVDLDQVVLASVSALTALAQRVGVSLAYEGPASQVVVTATPGLLRQAITLALSALLQSGGSRVTARLFTSDEKAILSLLVSERGLAPQQELIESAFLILETQKVEHRLVSTSEGRGLLLLFPLTTSRRVLVVEDNPSAQALYERLLENTEWEPIRVPHPQQASQMAASKRVSAIILDIMMPDTDGWSVLQALRLDPVTHNIPVVICSVLKDPELGYALGAASYLSKPVTRPQLLQCLRQVAQASRPA